MFYLLNECVSPTAYLWDLTKKEIILPKSRPRKTALDLGSEELFLEAS